jgi:phage gpG-like protein
MFDVDIDGAETLATTGERIKAMRSQIKDMLSKASADFANRTVSTSKRDYLSGGADHLKVRTGRLRSSIRYLIGEADKDITISFGSDVAYAAIHEFGGKTMAHRIEPRRKKFLRFFSGGNVVFSRGVNHPGSVIPARPFLTPAVEDEEPLFMNEIFDLLDRASNGMTA